MQASLPTTRWSYSCAVPYRAVARWVSPGVIVVAGVLAYWTSFGGVLVLDDPGAITANPTITSLTRSLSPPPNTTVSGRPFANFTFALNYAISGTDLWSYHIANLAIHVAAALALFGVLRRTLMTTPLMAIFGPVSPAIAGAISLLWTVHPLHTEAVTYIAQRVESLAGLLLLLTLYAAIRAGEKRSSGWTAAAIGCCALGMATKEVMAVAPVLVWLWYRTFRAGAPYPRAVRILPVTWLVLILLALDAPRGQTAGLGLGGWTPWSYALTQTEVIVHYLRLVFFPSPLVFHYAWPRITSLVAVAPQAGFLTVAAAMTIVGLVRRHPLGFAGAWFFGLLAPSSSFVPVVTQVAAEHRMYLASAALISLVVAGAFLLGRKVLSGSLGLTVGLACVAATAIMLGVQTYARNLDYSSAERLWHDTVQKQPGSPRAQLGYSFELVVAKRYAEAEPHARQAVAMEPSNPLARRTLGFALAGQSKLFEAVTEIQRGLELFPGDIVARRALITIHITLASSYADANRFEAAISELDAALRLGPDPGQVADLQQRRLRYAMSGK